MTRGGLLEVGDGEVGDRDGASRGARVEKPTVGPRRSVDVKWLPAALVIVRSSALAYDGSGELENVMSFAISRTSGEPSHGKPAKAARNSVSSVAELVVALAGAALSVSVTAASAAVDSAAAMDGARPWRRNAPAGTGRCTDMVLLSSMQETAVAASPQSDGAPCGLRLDAQRYRVRSLRLNSFRAREQPREHVAAIRDRRERLRHRHLTDVERWDTVTYREWVGSTLSAALLADEASPGATGRPSRCGLRYLGRTRSPL